ncbi:MAG TPA: hypothetical protein EYP62_04530 [Kiritimatiellae bacterium]|nr:hypothetical protein [Kiritimatiellia bacterium]
MSLVEEIIASLPQPETAVRGVWCCAFWTLVESRGAGLASSMRSEGDPYHTDAPAAVRGAGALEGRPAGELACYVLEADPVSASIGMAAINSLLDPPAQAVEINAADLLAEKAAGKTLAVVGHFPFVRRLESRVRRLWVFERRPRPGDFAAEMFTAVAPECEVICLSATTIMNHTAETLLASCRPEAFVVMVGPSTPFTPVLFDYGVDVLAGSVVTDAPQALRYLKEGAVFRQLKGRGVQLRSWARSPKDLRH